MIRGVVLWGILMLVVAGCARKPQETYPVEGVVKWSDGEPANELAGGTIGLQLVEGPAIPANPRGQVQPDGTFVLRTYGPGDGAPAGRYRAIVVPVMSRDDEDAQSESILDPRFQDYTISGLEITVKPEPSNQVQLTVKRTAKR